MAKKIKQVRPADFAAAVRSKLQAEPMFYVEYRGGVDLAPGAFVGWTRHGTRAVNWGCHFYNAEDGSLCQGRYNLTRDECRRAIAEWAGTPLREMTFLPVRD
jgi:hypothetical protein